MNDTPPEIRRRIHDLLRKRSGSERLEMCFAMFDAARSLVQAGIRDEGREPTREAVFLRTYGRDFTPEERERIVNRLRARRRFDDPADRM